MTTTVNPAETAEVFRKAREQAGAVDIGADLGGVQDAVLKFIKVEEFTTFLAEYVVSDGAIIVHFFPPREAFEISLTTREPRVTAEYLRYWKMKFPHILSPVAENYFKAGPPLLTATYVEEMTSWWMRAGGYAGRTDADDVIMRFFDTLDAALDAA
jgi:hypothetical protein